MSQDSISSTILKLDDKLYPVEKIVGKRIRKGKVEYLVRWKNYSSETDSWEPSKELCKTCHPLIKEFNREIKLQNNNNNSIQTSAESSSDTPISSIKNHDKLFNIELSNLLDKNLKPSDNITKLNVDNHFVKSKFKENLTDKISLENSEKRSFLCSKLNNGSNNIDFCKNIFNINTKDQHNVSKTTPLSVVIKNTNEPVQTTTNPQDQKKILYLEDNEIDEPCVPKSKLSAINGLHTNVIVKRTNFTKETDLQKVAPITLNRKYDNPVFKSLTDVANNLKRKSITVVTGGQKKSKFSEKEGSRVNPIAVIENHQIEHLKRIFHNRLDFSEQSGSSRNSKLFALSKPQTATEETLEKCLRNLPYQRYKESEPSDNFDSTAIRRTSVRQIEAANRFREIIVRKNVSAGFTEICLHNNSHSMPNSFNIKILNELSIALKQAVNDSSRIVLLTAIGSVFSSGIHLETIISAQKYVSNVKNIVSTTAQLTTPPSPNQQILDLAESLKKFLLELLHFPKPIVVGINGPAIGLGCAILPLCDLIYATESSSFYFPYTTLSQIPEAGSSLTLPMMVGMSTANQLLLCGRKWSAKEASNRGLISEIIFSDKFRPELFSRCEKLARVPSMNMETMKCMLRVHYKEQIDFTINMECRKLVEIWKSNEFRNNAQSFIDNELPNLLL